MTREEALYVARHLAAASHALGGSSEDFCKMIREGRYDESETVIAAHAALMIAPNILEARVNEFREAKSNVVDIAA